MNDGYAHGFGTAVDGAAISDEELTALALAADPDAPVADDAVPFDQVAGGALGGMQGAALLPAWYMPAPMSFARFGRTRLRRVATIVVIVAFLVIDAYGLCSTYGPR